MQQRHFIDIWSKRPDIIEAAAALGGIFGFQTEMAVSPLSVEAGT